MTGAIAHLALAGSAGALAIYLRRARLHTWYPALWVYLMILSVCSIPWAPHVPAYWESWMYTQPPLMILRVFVVIEWFLWATADMSSKQRGLVAAMACTAGFAVVMTLAGFSRHAGLDAIDTYLVWRQYLLAFLFTFLVMARLYLRSSGLPLASNTYIHGHILSFYVGFLAISSAWVAGGALSGPRAVIPWEAADYIITLLRCSCMAAWAICMRPVSRTREA